MKLFRTSGMRGDIIYQLPIMKKLGGGILAIHCNHIPLTPGGTAMTMADVNNFRHLLLKSTDYVDDVIYYNGETIDVDLDEFRNRKHGLDLGYSYLPSVIAKPHNINISADPWLDLSRYDDPCDTCQIVINRSTRYPGSLDWERLAPLMDKTIFIGHEQEYRAFVKHTGLKPEHVATPNFEEIAMALASSKLYIGNQSFVYSLAEAAKIPRVLEVCPKCPNCGPFGANGYTRIESALNALTRSR